MTDMAEPWNTVEHTEAQAEADIPTTSGIRGDLSYVHEPARQRYYRHGNACVDCDAVICDKATRCKSCANRGLSAAPLLALFNGETDGSIAVRLGVARLTVLRWRLGHHTIAATTADRVATRLGLHPANIWGDW